MSGTVLTVQAKLEGDAASMVSAVKKAEDSIDKLVRKSKDASSAGEFIGNGMLKGAQVGVNAIQNVIGAVLKTSVALAGVATASATAFAFKAGKAGLDRLMSIQDATVALTRMLGSAEKAADLTGRALEVVKGTPFAFPAFAEATRTLVAFGVEAGRVPKVLQAIADSAAASGQGAEAVQGLTQAFANLKVQGKLSSDILQSLGTSGVNGLGILANALGVSTERAQKMVSDGLIPADKAMDILVDGIENGSHGAAGDFNALAGAAKDLGVTLSGSFGNAQAAMARMGASWLKPFEKDLPKVINGGVIPLMDKLGEVGGKAMQKLADTGILDKVTTGFQKLTDKVEPAFNAFTNLLPVLSPLGLAFTAVKDVLPALEGPLDTFARVIVADLLPGISNLVIAMTPLIPAFGDLAGSLASGLGSIMPNIVDLMGGMVDVLVPVLDAVTSLPDPILGIVAALMALDGAGVPVMEMFGKLGTATQDFLTTVGEKLTAAAGTKAVGGFAEGMLGGLGKVTTFLGGPWGMAIGLAIGALGIFASSLTAPIQNSEELYASLDKVTGAFTDQTRAIVFKSLQEIGATDSAKQLGISLQTLTDAAMGNTGAMSEVDAALYANSQAIINNIGPNGQLTEAQRKQQEAITSVRNALNEQTAEVEDALTKNSQWLEATGATGAAVDALKGSVDAATGAVATNGATLDTNTAQGAANQAQLDKVSEAAKNLQTTQENTAGSAWELEQAQRASVGALVSTATQMGMTKDEANRLASEVLGIPVSRVIALQTTGFQVAHSQLLAIRDAVHAIPAFKNVRIAGGAGGSGGMTIDHNGGIYQGPADVKAFASGGFPTGIYKGTSAAIHKFAERETGWEAYISGRQSQRSRNIGLWAEAGERLGVPAPEQGGTTHNWYITPSAEMSTEQLAEYIIARFRFLMGG